jgi:ribosomal protein S15P/S13E
VAEKSDLIFWSVCDKFIQMKIFFIGVILRDSHGVAQVRFVTGNKILRILKAKGLAAQIPEDLYFLIKKAVAIRKHLERNRKVVTD